MVQEVLSKAVDWLGRQQSQTVILIGILAAIAYGGIKGIPAIIEHFDRQLQIQRDFDREQREATRASFEKIADRQAENHREMLQKVIDMKTSTAASP